MSASTLNPSKKSRGRPPVDSEQVGLRLDRNFIEALDAYAGKQTPPVKRTEALRRLAREALARRGFLVRENGEDTDVEPSS